MIDEKQIQEAIAYCQGKVDPNRSDAILLAACYILQDHMYQADTANANTGYSFAPPPAETKLTYSAEPETVGDYGDSDFLQAVRGMDAAGAWAVMDELMTTLLAVNPRLYNGVMRRIR